MVAKAFVLVGLLGLFVLAAYGLYLKYMLPYVVELRKEQERTERKQLERDEKLVDVAEDEYYEE